MTGPVSLQYVFMQSRCFIKPFQRLIDRPQTAHRGERSGTLEAILNSFAIGMSEPNLLIDCRSSRDDCDAATWPETLQMKLGEAAPKQSYEATFVRQCPHRQYDGLLFVGTTTPISVLDGYYRFWKK